MLFHRTPEPGDEDVRMWVPEEHVTTPVNLFKICFFAAFAFLGMAAFSQPEFRGVPLFVGGLILILLALTAGFLKWQSRYGEATLKATTQLAFGQRFEGWIQTELPRIPAHPVRVHIETMRTPRHIILLAREEVAPARMQTSPAGHVRIPFALQLPSKPEDWNPREVRVMVRTRTWPIGWGSTFLLQT